MAHMMQTASEVIVRLSVCLSACKQDYLNSSRAISMKPCVIMNCSSKKNPLKIGRLAAILDF